MPRSAESLESMISIVIACLMYSMFSQIPFTSLKESLGDKKFLKALLTTNFIMVPILVWLLARFLPQNPELLIGFYLVLLTPCIDYVIVFTALGKGDERLMLASTPILLVIQLVLLPLYLWMFMGKDAAGIVDPSAFPGSLLWTHFHSSYHCCLYPIGSKEIPHRGKDFKWFSLAACPVYGFHTLCSCSFSITKITGLCRRCCESYPSLRGFYDHYAFPI